MNQTLSPYQESNNNQLSYLYETGERAVALIFVGI